MDMIGGSDKEMGCPQLRPSRRNVLVTATVAAGALVSVPSAGGHLSGGKFWRTAGGAVPAGVLTLEQRSAMIKGITDVVLGAMKQPPDPAKRLFVQIFETAEGGFGVNGQVFVPRK
jgi:hypothetical protein